MPGQAPLDIDARSAPPHGNDREAHWSAAMRAANRGDAAAYRRLLEEIAPVLRGLARRRLSGLGLTPDEAEDVVQETLVALHAKRATWDERRPFLPWLYAISRYKLLDAARRLGRARRATASATVDELAETLAAPAPERDAVGIDAAAILEALPPRERGVVTALVFDGVSVAEAARAFGVGPTAIRVAFHRALSRLRRLADGEDEAAARAEAAARLP